MYLNGINYSGDRGERVNLEHSMCYSTQLFSALYLPLTWADTTWHKILASSIPVSVPLQHQLFPCGNVSVTVNRY